MRIEDANCDSLMTLDCCHAGNASRSLPQNTNEILAASVPEASSYSGARAYSKMLKKKLEMLPIPFTALQLHEEMVKERNKPMSQNPDSLIATPRHGYAGNGGGRTVILRPPKHLHMIDDSDPSPSGVTPEAAVPTNPHIFMEIELDQSQQLDVAKWEAWFAERPPPPSMFGLKFYTKEEVHVKVITENAVFARTADDGLDTDMG
jgi:hypothetical protein